MGWGETAHLEMLVPNFNETQVSSFISYSFLHVSTCHCSMNLWYFSISSFSTFVHILSATQNLNMTPLTFLMTLITQMALTIYKL